MFAAPLQLNNKEDLHVLVTEPWASCSDCMHKHPQCSCRDQTWAEMFLMCPRGQTFLLIELREKLLQIKHFASVGLNLVKLSEAERSACNTEGEFTSLFTCQNENSKYYKLYKSKILLIISTPAVLPSDDLNSCSASLQYKDITAPPAFLLLTLYKTPEVQKLIFPVKTISAEVHLVVLELLIVSYCITTVCKVRKIFVVPVRASHVSEAWNLLLLK